MAPSPRILTGTVIALLVIGMGLTFGYYIYTHKGATPSVPKIAAAEKPEPNFNTYEISPPSRATTLETRDIEINPAGNTAFVLMPKKDAGDFKTGQRILLYAENATLIDTLGEISSIDEGREQFADFVTVHMKLNGDKKVSAKTVKTGKVIIKRIPDSARLPLSALVKNEKDEPYVWEAVTNDDGTTSAYYKRADVAATTYDYFVIVPQSHLGGMYILNPDSKLRDGQKINVRRINYTAPPQTEEARVFQKMERRRLLRENHYRGQMLMAKAAASGAAPATGGKTMCGPTPPETTKKFIESIKKMTPAQGAQNLPSDKPTPTP